MWLWIAPFVWAGEMEITVTDPAVTEVHLACDGQQLRAPVVDGVARFPGTLVNCTVSLFSTVGRLDRNDRYVCGMTGCQRRGIEHREVASDPNRVTIILTDASARLLELRCPSGYRERAPVTQNTAVFDGVPEGEDCDLWWKNAAPGRGRKIRPGTWFCQNNGGTGVCRQR